MGSVAKSITAKHVTDDILLQSLVRFASKACVKEFTTHWLPLAIVCVTVGLCDELVEIQLVTITTTPQIVLYELHPSNGRSLRTNNEKEDKRRNPGRRQARIAQAVMVESILAVSTHLTWNAETRLASREWLITGL